jgi:5'-3' exonuclease
MEASVSWKLMAADGNNLLMRALFATKRASMTAHGVPTGPLLVFVNSLSRHIREESPTHIGVAWDGGGRGVRQGIDDTYKANRASPPDEEHELKESAFALAKEFCTLAGIWHTGYASGGVEADDIIADWWRDWRDQSLGEMIILSSDKDLLQLVDRPWVEQVRLSSANTETDRWDPDRVRGHYGVPVRLVPAILAIAGDTSDNIIGVRGIGPKKAARALQECGLDFERCIVERWPDQADHLRENYQLTDLRSKWQHPAARPLRPPEAALTRPQSARWPEFVDFLDRYELKSVRERLEAGTLWVSPPSRSPVGRPLRVRQGDLGS